MLTVVLRLWAKPYRLSPSWTVCHTQLAGGFGTQAGVVGVGGIGVAGGIGVTTGWAGR
jgi:hypothetical protein